MKVTDVLVAVVLVLVVFNFLMTATLMNSLSEVEATAEEAADELADIERQLDDMMWVLYVDEDGNVYAVQVDPPQPDGLETVP